MSAEITPRAVEVLRRGLETARLDPISTGVRVRVVAGATRVSFEEGPEDGDEVIEAGGIRIFVASSAAGRVVDVSAEHDQIIVR